MPRGWVAHCSCQCNPPLPFLHKAVTNSQTIRRATPVNVSKSWNSIDLDKMENVLNSTQVMAMPGILQTEYSSPKRRGGSGKRAQSDKQVRYCVCGRGDGDMIGCDGDKCEGNNWYHLDCLQLNISESRSKRLRGDWFCPSCTEKEAKAQDKVSKRLKTAAGVKYDMFRECDYVLSSVEKNEMRGGGVSSSLPPLRVESAERQSRQEMEILMSSARLLAFDSAGKAQSPLDKCVGFPHGLCQLSLCPSVFSAVKSLHEEVVECLEVELRLTPWAGVGEADARKRGYAFLPPRFGKFGKRTLSAAGVRFHAAEKRGREAKKDETANWNSCFRLSNANISPEHESCLREIVNAVSAAVPAKYKECITLDQLQAIQPNLHNDRDHLPVHMDSPLNDGFGVVIVTICVQKSADILLLSHKSSKTWAFHAPEGSMYVLCGTARNECDHGVLCPLEKRRGTAEEAAKAAAPKRRKGRGKRRAVRPGRESLNLRFALHGNVPSKPFCVTEEMPMLFS